MNTQNVSKTCSVCHNKKPMSEFSVDKQKTDQLTSCCNECRKAKRKAIHILKKDKIANNKREEENIIESKLPDSLFGSKVLILTQKMYAIVDEDDYNNLIIHNWFCYKNRNTIYAARNIPRPNGTQYIQPLHREVMGLLEGDGFIVDHINRNGLDNRKTNLRIVSCSLNNHNRKLQRNNTSGYYGVSWHKESQKWCASISLHNKAIWVGLFPDAKSAAIARDIEALKLYGASATLNFSGGIYG